MMTPSRRSRGSGDQRRREIVTAALDLLGEGGISAASTTEIAARVGLTQSGLFKHFKNKEEILRAAMDAIGERVGERVAQAATSGATSPQRLRAVIESYLDVAAELPALTALLFGGESRMEGTVSFLRAAIQARFDRLRDVLEGLLNDGVRSGQIAPTLDVEAAALLLVGVAQTILLRRHLADQALDHRRELDRMWVLVEATLRP
jgi:AcrR family transcriptional regulator